MQKQFPWLGTAEYYGLWCADDHVHVQDFLNVSEMPSKWILLQVLGLGAIMSSVFASRMTSCIIFSILGYLLVSWRDTMRKDGFPIETTFWTWLLPALFALAEACRFSISKLVSKQYWSELGPNGGSRQPNEPYHEIHYARDVALNTAVGWHGLPSEVISYATESIQDGILAVLGTVGMWVLVAAQDPLPLYAWLLLSGVTSGVSLLGGMLTCSFPALDQAIYKGVMAGVAAAVILAPSLRSSFESALHGQYKNEVSLLLQALGGVVLGVYVLGRLGIDLSFGGIMNCIKGKGNRRRPKRL